MDMDVVSTKTNEVVMTEAIARKPKRRRPTKRRKSKKVIKAEKRMREKLKAKKLKLKLSKVLKVYEIPSSILEKYKLEVQVPDNVQAEMVRRRCHQQNYEEFQSSEVPCNLANFMTAFKHATEDRNFEVLYELMSKALEIRNGFLLQQIYEYLYIAILYDEEITDREEVLSEFLARIKLLNDCDPKKYQVREHTFTYEDERESQDEEVPVKNKKPRVEEKKTASSDSSDEE